MLHTHLLPGWMVHTKAEAWDRVGCTGIWGAQVGNLTTGDAPCEGDADGVVNCNDQCPAVDDRVFAPECEGAIPAVSEWGNIVLVPCFATAVTISTIPEPHASACAVPRMLATIDSEAVAQA